MKTYNISISRMNQKGFNYLDEVFNTSFNENSDYLSSYLSELEDATIIIEVDDEQSDETRTILSIIDEAADNNSLTVNRLLLLDIDQLNAGGHEYLKRLFEFPDYYGENLDGLYDCLSEIDTINIKVINLVDVNEFSLGVIRVLDDVAEEYGNINITYEHEDDELLDD